MKTIIQTEAERGKKLRRLSLLAVMLSMILVFGVLFLLMSFL
jgi:hypothetical protein